MHFLISKYCIFIPISLKFVPKELIDNKSALVQVMAWRRTGDKAVSESIVAYFTDAYICVTRPQWTGSPKPRENTIERCHTRWEIVMRFAYTVDSLAVFQMLCLGISGATHRADYLTKWRVSGWLSVSFSYKMPEHKISCSPITMKIGVKM